MVKKGTLRQLTAPGLSEPFSMLGFLYLSFCIFRIKKTYLKVTLKYVFHSIYSKSCSAMTIICALFAISTLAKIIVPFSAPASSSE